MVPQIHVQNVFIAHTKMPISEYTWLGSSVVFIFIFYFFLRVLPAPGSEVFIPCVLPDHVVNISCWGFSTIKQRWPL